MIYVFLAVVICVTTLAPQKEWITLPTPAGGVSFILPAFDFS